MKPENLLSFANGLTEGEQTELLAVLHGVSLASSAIARKVPVAEAHGDRCGLLAKAGVADLIQLQAKLLASMWAAVEAD